MCWKVKNCFFSLKIVVLRTFGQRRRRYGQKRIDLHTCGHYISRLYVKYALLEMCHKYDTSYFRLSNENQRSQRPWSQMALSKWFDMWT